MSSEEKPKQKRKKYFTKLEILDKLKENGDQVQEVVWDICEELTPFDINNEESLILEDRSEQLEVVSKAFSAKVYRH